VCGCGAGGAMEAPRVAELEVEFAGIGDGVDAAVCKRGAMRPETIRRLDELFAAAPVLVAGPGVSEEEILEAERDVGTPFDPDYKEFVLRYGGAMVGSLPVLGLRHAEVMGAETVVDATARFRAAGWTPTDRWVVVSMDLAGNPIGLDPDGGVWVSDHDAGDVSRVAHNFEQFVLQLLDESST
jgi:hypothetical protein